MTSRTIMALVFSLTLAGCAVGDTTRAPGDGPGAFSGPPANATERVEQADWSRAEKLVLRVRQNRFDPLVLTLQEGRAYVLTLVNGDDVDHTFYAPDLFEAIAVRSLSGAEQPVTPETGLVAVGLPARASRELAFVTVRDGRYEFSNGGSNLFAFGKIGVVVIEWSGQL